MSIVSSTVGESVPLINGDVGSLDSTGSELVIGE